MSEITYISLTKKISFAISDNDFKAMTGSFAWARMRQNRFKLEVDWDRTRAICAAALHYRQADDCLRDEIERWCQEHCTNLYHIQRSPIVAHFMSHRDAVACKLYFHDSTLTSTVR